MFNNPLKQSLNNKENLIKFTFNTFDNRFYVYSNTMPIKCLVFLNDNCISL